MEMETLKDKIESLDPKAHKALREALTAEYRRLSGQGTEPGSQRKCPPELFDELFQRAANDIGEQYIRGTSDYIRKYQPDLYRRTEEADQTMNEVWAAGRHLKASIEEFRKALNEWHLLHLKQIEIYTEVQGRCQSWSDSVCGES